MDMDEKTESINEQAMPNPLERLAAMVTIHIEKGELPLAINLLQRADTKALLQWARATQSRSGPNIDPALRGKINRAVGKYPARATRH